MLQKIISDDMTVYGVSLNRSCDEFPALMTSLAAIGASKKEELIVFGFVRQTQQSLPYKKYPFYVIPQSISCICLSYFGVNHYISLYCVIICVYSFEIDVQR